MSSLAIALIIVQLDLEIWTVPWGSRERDVLGGWRHRHVVRYFEAKKRERRLNHIEACPRVAQQRTMKAKKRERQKAKRKGGASHGR